MQVSGAGAVGDRSPSFNSVGVAAKGPSLAFCVDGVWAAGHTCELLQTIG